MEQRALLDYGYSLWEVNIYDPDGTDLARIPGVSAQATSEQEPENKLYIPERAIDDDMTTRWGSAHCCQGLPQNQPCAREGGQVVCDNEESKDPQGLEITLAEPALVDHVVLKWEDAYAEKYCVKIIP